MTTTVIYPDKLGDEETKVGGAESVLIAFGSKSPIRNLEQTYKILLRGY